jgi:4-diphosphocytidyl-2-C-methyl-D-erythritol kinase
MLTFPNCKINLGLNITSKREDGFHNLETVFVPIVIKDVLEIISSDKTELTTTGNTIDIPAEQNICIKAYDLLKKDFHQLPGVKIHLHKNIPSGAGLGGGSADASFTLKLLNDKYQLNQSTGQLVNYALRLGSDCPFFIINKPCLATGRGEILEQISIDLSSYKILIVNPGIHINTGWAFTQLTPSLPAKSIKEIINQPIETWKAELKNDFEEPVFKQYPEIKSIKEQLYNNGAIYAAMSGSGSSVFGFYKKEVKIPHSFPANYFVKEINLK